MSIFPALLAAAFLALSFYGPFRDRLKPFKTPLGVAIYILTRFGVFFVVYIVLAHRNIGGDLLWFHDQGVGVLAGKLPYRDIKRCCDAPLFAYLMAIPYGLWGNMASSVLLFIAFDFLSIVLLRKLTRVTLGETFVPDITWLYIINPAVWIITVRYGQDESVVVALLLLAVLVYTTGNRWWQPLILSLSVLMTKYTTAVGAFAIYTYSKMKLRDAIIAALLIIAVFAPLHLAGVDVMYPFKVQSGTSTGISVSSLFDLLAGILHWNLHLEKVQILLSAMAVLALIYVCHRRRLAAWETLTVVLMAFLFLVPKSYKLYRLWALGPLGMHALRNRQTGRYALYTGLICTLDDFVLKPGNEIVYPMLFFSMVVMAVALLCFEGYYIMQILSGKPRPLS